MKKNLLVKTLAVALTAVTVLASNVTATDVQAATPKAIKVQSFKRTGTKTATLTFKKPAKATKYQVRYSFYQDFRKGFTETSKSMTLVTKKGKSKKYTTASKKYTTITTPKSGSTISVKIEDPRLQKITYKYQRAEATNITIDGVNIPSNGNPDPRDTVYKSLNGYEYVDFYCAVQIRYYNKGWSKWSNAVRINNGKYHEKKVEKELSRTPYLVCGDGYPAGTLDSDGELYNGCGYSVSLETFNANPDEFTVHLHDCPYNKYANNGGGDLVKYSVTSTWSK